MSTLGINTQEIDSKERPYGQGNLANNEKRRL